MTRLCDTGSATTFELRTTDHDILQASESWTKTIDHEDER
jgi:hypothetical protein